jgi:hypothetical protein
MRFLVFLPNWYKTKFDAALYKRKIKNYFDNFEPVLSLYFVFISLISDLGLCLCFWESIKYFGLDLSFHFKIFYAITSFTYIIVSVTTRMIDYWECIHRFMEAEREQEREAERVRREEEERRKRLKPKHFFVSSYFPEYWVEELENANCNWLEDRG